MHSHGQPKFAYRRSPEQDLQQPARHPLIVVGAGPVGLVAAIDLAEHGMPVVLIDEDDTVSVGSRAVCYAKRSLEVFDRLGCGEAIVARGVGWSVGRVFFKDREVFSFNLLSETGHHRPAFVNLQQYHLEEILVKQALATGRVDLRWKNRLVALRAGDERVRLRIATPEGEYELDCDWVVAADGADSAVRRFMGLECRGRSFRERFLIADVLMHADYPVERRFWFDPPFHRGLSALMHRQADNVWRIDMQLGPDIDPVEEGRPERVLPRLAAMLGGRPFELIWSGVYTFTSGRLQAFRHGRVLFAGDAAHQVSPFGARSANSGVQDAENLAWKLHLVVEGRAPQRLLDSYGAEREYAADENIAHSARSTEFITPKGAASRAFRDAALMLAAGCPFARRLVNSGRLSTPALLADSPLNTPDRDPFSGGLAPGTPAADAPVAVNGELRWLLQFIGGGFVGLYFAQGMSELPVDVAVGIARLTLDRIPAETRVVVEPGNPIELPPGVMKLEDYEDFVVQRYDAMPGAYYLLRPDQHVCARWRSFDPAAVRAALLHATCNDG